MAKNLRTRLDTARAVSRGAGAGDDRVRVSLERLMLLRHQATGYSFLPSQPSGSLLSGRYASRLRGRGLNFEELRRYQPGDDVRTIDWRVTARTRAPHVRVYTEERDRPVLFVVDQRIHMFFGSRDRMKSVVAAEAVALGAWRALDVGDRVGALVFDDEGIEEIRPHRSTATVVRLLELLVEKNAALAADSEVEPAPGQLNEALEAAARLVRHDALVVVISDFSGADEETTQLVTRVAAHNDLIGMLTVDPMRRTPVDSGVITLTDGRLQLRVDMADKRFRERLAEDYRRESGDIAHSLRTMSAPFIELSTEGEVAAQILAQLGAR